MKIYDLLKGTKIIQKINDDNVEISNVHYHSGHIKENGLFVAIKGQKTDGHRYIKSAIDKGAIAVVVEEKQQDIDIPQYIVEDARKALAVIGSNFYSNPSKELKIIGITATNGKTTTSFMLNSILNEHKLNTGIIGTVFVKYGKVKIPSILTTPQSLDLQKHFRDMVEAGVSHVVMEVSSSALEMYRTYGVNFDVVTLNNISREHIDNHGSFEKYIAYKSSLITGVDEDCFAILNLDDEISKSLISRTKAKVMTYGISDTSGDVYISHLDFSTGFAKYILWYKEMGYRVDLSVPGYHSVYNSLVAICTAISLGIPMKDIVLGIKHFGGIERRFELIYDYDFKIVDDHFANKGNIDITLKTLQFMDYRNFHLVYAIRGSRGYTVNKENAEAIAYWFDKLGINEIIATKSIGHTSEKDFVTKEEEEIFLQIMAENNIKVHYYDTISEATRHALNIVKKGDLIVLGGTQGMDYGCNIILDQIAEDTDIPLEKLKRPLENRVAGKL